MKFDARGRELLDNTPLAQPINFKPPMSLAEQVRAAVRHELSEAAARSGRETFEEADDFDVGDDYDPRSPWELTSDQENYSPPPEPETKLAPPGLAPGGATPASAAGNTLSGKTPDVPASGNPSPVGSS